MKNKGFTLIELLGVMVILAVLTAVVIPSVINFIKSSNEKQDKLVTELVYNAMDLYIKDYSKQFLKVNGTKYSISLKKLVSQGYIKSTLLLSNSDEDLVQKKCIEVTYNNGFNYEMKDECEATHYVVDYDGIDGTNYQSSIEAGGELRIEFVNFIPPKIVVYSNGERLSESEYSYQDNVLVVDNAKGNIEVEYKEKVYLATLPEKTYFKEDEYREKIKSIKFLDYIDTGTKYLAKYDLSERQDGSIIGWIDKEYNLYIGSDWNIYSKDLSNAFRNMKAVENIEFANLNTSETTKMSSMFNNLSNIKEIDVSSFDTSKNRSFNSMFYGCKNLIKLDVSGFDTGNAREMAYMFEGCKSLEELDISKWNTTNVTTMEHLFVNCEKLTKLDVSKWNTKNVTKMNNMFYGCRGLLELDVSNFDTSNVKTMAHMFYDCKNLTQLDVSNFDTNKVETFLNMFNKCTNVTELNLSSFKTDIAQNMQGMFGGCKSLTSLNLSNFNTEFVTNMAFMFQECSGLTELNVSSFDTKNVISISGMFNSCSSLTELDLSSFETPNLKSATFTFHVLSNLKTLNLCKAEFDSIDDYSAMFSTLPTTIKIYVKDKTQQDWISTNFSNLADNLEVVSQ